MVSRLDVLGRACGATRFQVMLALWSLLLCRHAGQEEVVVGSPYHGRDAAGTESLIGYFVNMLALRVEAHRALALQRRWLGVDCCVVQRAQRDASRVGAVSARSCTMRFLAAFRMFPATRCSRRCWGGVRRGPISERQLLIDRWTS